MNKGTKYDQGKLEWTMYPWDAATEELKILMYGAEKYEKDNWKKVEPDRYGNAIMRHVIAYLSGEKIDPESGMSHLAHVRCNAAFLMYFDGEKK